jgi:hypothetical protein
MPQRRAPELRPVMRPSYGACSACFAGETQGAGQWTGGGRVLLHLQRVLQQKPLRRDAAPFLSPPVVIIHIDNVNDMSLYQQLSILANPWTAGLLRRRAVAYSETATYSYPPAGSPFTGGRGRTGSAAASSLIVLRHRQ